MANDSFIAKVQASLLKRNEEKTLVTEEKLRLAHLRASGFSPIAAANVITAARSVGRTI